MPGPAGQRQAREACLTQQRQEETDPSVPLGGVGSDPTFLWPLTECYAVTPHWA